MEKHSYRVLVDDNFHYVDESELYVLGEFGSCKEAVAVCKKLVDEWLREAYRFGMDAETLWESYTHFGEDPFVGTADADCRFSAWDYARQRCEEMCVDGLW